MVGHEYLVEVGTGSGGRAEGAGVDGPVPGRLVWCPLVFDRLGSLHDPRPSSARVPRPLSPAPSPRARRPPAGPGSSPTTLHYVATVEQVGPVAYRDPLGRVSPDGRWLAFTERDQLNVTPVEGGARRTMGSGTESIRFIAWLPDSRTVAVRERVFDRSRQEWWLYDRSSGERTRLWPDYAWKASSLEPIAALRGSE